jgi:hypothetical protein
MVNDARSDELIQKTLTKTGIGSDLLEAIQRSAVRLQPQPRPEFVAPPDDASGAAPPPEVAPKPAMFSVVMWGLTRLRGFALENGNFTIFWTA